MIKSRDVRELESRCEAALEKAIADLDLQNWQVSQHTLHMMAKAAVAVLEATANVASSDR